MSRERTTPANEFGHLLHRWTDRDGQEWACCAYDHGPFCRLCMPVDAEMSNALDRVESGVLRAYTRPNGGIEFKARNA